MPKLVPNTLDYTSSIDNMAASHTPVFGALYTFSTFFFCIPIIRAIDQGSPDPEVLLPYTNQQAHQIHIAFSIWEYGDRFIDI